MFLAVGHFQAIASFHFVLSDGKSSHCLWQGELKREIF
jgi:hypothetical protein